ncbi:MAG: 6-aminohexanoate hydrolase, partial [Nitratireductor sp.]
MRILAKIAVLVIALAVLAVVGLAGWLYVAPPALIRVGAAYSAKMVCSNVFLADRDATQVLAEDVQAPGHPLLGYIRIEVDEAHRAVSAALLGLFGRERAVMREGLGCTVASGDALLEGLSASQAAPVDTQAPWPEGEIVAPSQTPELEAILADDGLTGPGMRAVVVVKNGRIVGE